MAEVSFYAGILVKSLRYEAMTSLSKNIPFFSFFYFALFFAFFFGIYILQNLTKIRKGRVTSYTYYKEILSFFSNGYGQNKIFCDHGFRTMNRRFPSDLSSQVFTLAPSSRVRHQFHGSILYFT